MSIRFRMDGAFFPTEVKNGELIIYVGQDLVKVPFKFLTEEYGFDNTQIPINGIMCYIKSSDGVVIMRFDGTVTKFNRDNVVVGFSKFDPKVILDKLLIMNVGCARDATTNIRELRECTVYHAVDGTSWLLEVVDDVEAIEFNPNHNDGYIADLMKGTRFDPILIKQGPHTYVESNGNYTVIGKPILTTGFHNV